MMRVSYVLILVLLLGCDAPDPPVYKYRVGQPMQLVLDGTPVMITERGHGSYTVRYRDSQGEIREAYLQEFELEPRRQR